MKTERRLQQDRRQFDFGPPEVNAERRHQVDRRFPTVEQYEISHKEGIKGFEVLTYEIIPM